MQQLTANRRCASQDGDISSKEFAEALYAAGIEVPGLEELVGKIDLTDSGGSECTVVSAANMDYPTA